jgi:hypothetical protein
MFSKLRRRTLRHMVPTLLGVITCSQWTTNAVGQNAQVRADAWTTGQFQWTVGQPLLSAQTAKLPASAEHPWIAIKDPSIVRYEGKWHLFCTLRKQKSGDGRIRIGYSAFEDWSESNEAAWSVLELTPEYHGAPQIFYFEPQRLWYLIYQASDATRGLKFGPCYSTNPNIADPSAWSVPAPLYVVEEGKKAGLDFWIICDDAKAHLFFTTLDGRMWRADTKLDQFPNQGWSVPSVALKADIFEASHTYRLPGREQFITFVEAQAGKRRYFKAFVANSLDGQWRALAATRESAFVSPHNVVNQSSSWATSYSHGEFLRAGFDQRLELRTEPLQLLFQGASDAEYQKGNYGEIPWRLGLLTQEVVED